jgi:putative heme transporter
VNALRRIGPWRLLFGIASVALAIALLVVGLPLLLGTGWPQIVAVWRMTQPGAVGLLVLAWAVSLWTYTWVVTATLPVPRLWAFVMNTAGSALANLLPFGGALGAVVVYAMARDRGLPPARVAASGLVTNTWNMLGRMALPAAALGLLVLLARPSDPRLSVAAGLSAAACAALGLLLVAVLGSPALARWIGTVLDRLARPLRPRSPARSLAAPLLKLRSEVVKILRSRWPALSVAMAVTLALQAVLFLGCLAATGAWVGVVGGFAAFAVSRALTMVVVTPNGVGVSEAGAAALLIALSAAPAPAGAAVLLFGLITHVLEIVVGGATLVGWWLTRPVHADRSDRAGAG